MDTYNDIKGIQVLPLYSSYASGVTNASLHLRPLTDDEVVQQALYLHSTYIKE